MTLLTVPTSTEAKAGFGSYSAIRDPQLLCIDDWLITQSETIELISIDESHSVFPSSAAS